MRHFKFLSVIIVFSFILITGCKKDIDTEKSITSEEVEASAKQTTQSAAELKLSAELKAKLEKLRASLPTGYEERLKQSSVILIKQHPEYRDLVNRVLNAVAPTPCNDNTPINQWLDGELADWDFEIIFFALITGMLDFPTFDALLFENSQANQYFGVNGEYSQKLTKTFKDLKRFWNIQSNGIVMAGMHGSMLRDRERVIRIDMILFGDTRDVAEFWADLIITLLNEAPQYRNGNHPIFTFNAFAQESFLFPPAGIVPAKIVMGDGIMDAYAGIGFDDVAPQAVLAHEFGHHIQFQLGLFGNVNSPEATRRTELMADAYSAYYLSHARGATMQWKRVKQFLEVFYNIGDCSFTSNGHHGTPAQRMAAAEWGYSVANNAQKQGHILTSQEFTALFEAQLPLLVAQ